MLLLLINLVLLYRGPGLLTALWRRWHARKSILLDTLAEYGRDILGVGAIVIVYACVYRAIAFSGDLAADLFERRSWPGETRHRARGGCYHD